MMKTECPILVDICWTLYRSNTTFDFLDWLIDSRLYRCIRWIGRSHIGRAINIGIMRITHYDIQRALCLCFTRSYSAEQLQEQARLFITEELKDKRITEAWELIKGRDVIIATGTMPVIASEVAKIVGTRNVHAGSLYKEHIREHYPIYDILTDNLTDMPLIQHARHAYIIVYANQTRWDRQLKDIPHTYIHIQDRRRY